MSESTDLLSFRADVSALDGETAEGLNAALDRIARIVADLDEERENGDGVAAMGDPHERRQ